MWKVCRSEEKVERNYLRRSHGDRSPIASRCMQPLERKKAIPCAAARPDISIYLSKIGLRTRARSSRRER